MAGIITKEEYEFYKSQDPKDLTQEELNWVHDYEKGEANAPSKEDLEWARFILNEKDPYYQRLNKKNGDFDKANNILQQEKAANEVMQQKGQDLYVKKVNTTPEDVVKKGGYKFNWRDAYDNVKGEKLRATEGDAKKLQDFINSNMYNVDDDAKLQQIAYNLHMYNPNTMKWTDFINSEQGEEFKKYLEDVRNTQTEKAVEDIWEGKEPSQQWTPFGYKEVPGAKKLVDFMLPVSKEYAKNHFNDEDFSLAGPLATDVAANLIMTGTGALPATKVMYKPLVSYLYGNVAAPAITETGNVAFNDESIPEAFVRTAEGTAINLGTPQILEGMLSRIGRGLPKGSNRSVQKMIDEATNKAEKVNKEMLEGKPFRYNIIRGKDDPLEYHMLTPKGVIQFSTDPAKSNAKSGGVFESVSTMPDEAISDKEFIDWLQGLSFSRSNYGKTDAIQKIKNLQDKATESIKDKLLLKKAEALSKDGDLRSLTPSELRQLGFPDKESFMNWLIRSFKYKTPESLKTYLTNASGRPEFGRSAGPIENINRLLGTSFFKKDKTNEEKQKSRIERLLGM
jgi:hypothetical protein